MFPIYIAICIFLRVIFSVQFSLSRVGLFVTSWTAAHWASLSTNFQSLLKLMSIESVMSSNQLILSNSLLLLPSIFPSIRVFSSESVLHIRWPKYWSYPNHSSSDSKKTNIYCQFNIKKKRNVLIQQHR